MQDRNISPWGCDVDFQSRGLSWVVTQVEEGMQCSEHGIEKGWKIIKWNGVLINDTNSTEIEDYLRAGNSGTITFRKCEVKFYCTIVFFYSIFSFIEIRSKLNTPPHKLFIKN